MSSLQNIPPSLLWALCGHEVFRRLGFPAEDIYATLDGVDNLFLLVRQGSKEFAAMVAPAEQVRSDGLLPDFEKHWATAAEAWKTAPAEESRRVWRAFLDVFPSVQFLSAMTRKGLTFDISSSALYTHPGES